MSISPRSETQPWGVPAARNRFESTFGLAKFQSNIPQETIDTDPGQVIGTMRYMAPEQLRGHEVDPGWDLWALTVIAYEMLKGTNPFAGATTAECYRNKPG